jgi:hypothetical protein
MPALSVPSVRPAQAPEATLGSRGACWILKEFPRTVAAPHEAAASSRVILMTNASWAFAALLLCLKEVAGRPA